jgi:hypothetical protein
MTLRAYGYVYDDAPASAGDMCSAGCPAPTGKTDPSQPICRLTVVVELTNFRSFSEFREQ